MLRRRPVLLAVSVLTLVALAACEHVDRPPGPSPLRYRDEVFTDVSVARDLQYGSAPGRDGDPEALLLDLYQPRGDTVARRPALVYAHGGGFSGGDKGSGLGPFFARKFARLGYVAVSINYRLLAPPGGCSGANADECTPAAIAAIDDAQAAVRWLRRRASTYRIDPNRIAIAGESAGAIIATGVGLTSDLPGDSGNPDQRSDVQGWMSLSGGFASAAFVDGGDAPGYLFAGTEDTVVPYQWSVTTAAALEDAGVFVVFKTFEGDGHVPFEEHATVIVNQTVYFFHGVLDLAHAPR